MENVEALTQLVTTLVRTGDLSQEDVDRFYPGSHVPDLFAPCPLVDAYLRGRLPLTLKSLLDQPAPTAPDPAERYLQFTFTQELDSAQAAADRLVEALVRLWGRRLLAHVTRGPSVLHLLDALGQRRLVLFCFVILTEGQEHLTNQQLNDLCGSKET